jgi:hypothetical protein
MKRFWLGNMKYIAMVLIIMAFVCSIYFYFQNRKIKSQESIKKLMSEIKINDSKSKVKEFIDLESNLSQISLIDYDDIWTATTPLEIGASSWRLIINFNDSKVVSLKIRTEDSENIKPIGAPEDQIAK